MFRFENIAFFYALLAIPLLFIFFWLALKKKRAALLKFGDYNLIKELSPEASTVKPLTKFIFLMLALSFLIFAMINPQQGSKLVEVQRKGADIMIALDVSNSMKAEDFSPNRLDRAKYSIEKLIDDLKGDRIGIIVFGGEAYVQLPITTDYAAAKLFLQTIDTDIIPTQGTAIGTAIDLAMESFGAEEGNNKAIVVITDGENHEDDAIETAGIAAEKGIAIHTIGMGSVDGAPIPLYKGKTKKGFRKDKEGNTIVTKLNENMLQEIAAAGNGIYVRANNSATSLSLVLKEINELEKKEFESKIYADYTDWYQWPLGIALFFLLIEILISERKSKWLKKINLFGDA